MKRVKATMSRCSTCDAWYGPAETEEHRHPEPQGGPPRDALIGSRLPYWQWVLDTPEGRAWLATDPKRNRP